MTWIVVSGPGSIDGGGRFTSGAGGVAIVRFSSVLDPLVKTVVLVNVLPNDNFADRMTISAITGKTTGNNSGATNQRGEPRHAGNRGGSSVWFEWRAPVSGVVEFTTAGSDFDTLLAVYTDAKIGKLKRVAHNDDYAGVVSSMVAFRVKAGNRYRIALDGYNAGKGAASGRFELNWSYRAIPVTGVRLSSTRLTLESGSAAQLTATVRPAEAAGQPAKVFNQNVTWRSSNSSVATVDENGLITAHKPGRATITVRTADGNKRAVCRVTVTKASNT